MSESINTSPIERQPNVYDPTQEPAMRRVIVQDELKPGLPVKVSGFQTDIPGVKVNLQELAELNKRVRETKASSSPGRYENVYFTTESGTIYRARNLEDGTWEIESPSTPQRTMIREACTIEVGQRFTSPLLINDQPELNTSPVKSITLVDENAKPVWMGVPVSPKETDIAARFTQARHNRGTS